MFALNFAQIILHHKLVLQPGLFEKPSDIRALRSEAEPR
jgi:hypothetical protein